MTTYNKKRIVAALLLIFIVFSTANYYLDLGIFPRFAKLIMLLGVLMILIFAFRFAPTREESEEHRRRRGAV